MLASATGSNNWEDKQDESIWSRQTGDCGSCLRGKESEHWISICVTAHRSTEDIAGCQSSGRLLLPDTMIVAPSFSMTTMRIGGLGRLLLVALQS